MRRPAIMLATLLAAIAGLLSAPGDASAQFFWDTDPPKKTKPRKPKASAARKPTIQDAAEGAATDAAKVEAAKTPEAAAAAAAAKEAEVAREAARVAKEAADVAKAAADAASKAPLNLADIVVPATPKPDAGPVVAAAFKWLAVPENVAKAHKDDLVAAKVLYGERSGDGLWIGSESFHAKGKAVIEEIAKADDWGLDAKAFDIPVIAPGATGDALGEAEAKLTLAALKYARHARGGRVNPRSLSRIWDQDPPIRNPIDVVNALAQREEADSYLRGLHPQHRQFKQLRAALLKARGPAEPEVALDPALQVKLPKGQSLKPGSEHADVALLRQRLKVTADAGAKDTLYDPKLVDAVVTFQKEKGLEAKGWLTPATRSALNSEGEAKKPNPTRDTQRIVINMERWRWMPEHLGDFYVWNNIPEYATRVVKNDETMYKEKIIVGQPSWPTPVFSADMLYVMFYPSWGMPDGIKQKELLPRIRAGGGGFFGLFGGGSSVIEAYDLKVYYNGREISPSSVDWGSVNISNYSFIQPPGPKNPLGVVKFRFPNKHDVYMHDTPERELFARGSRALSHGCIRVANPMRFAEILIEHDRGPGNGRTGGDVTLKTPFPVHITYFTVIADENGRVSTFGDIYGHDNRISSALGGRSLPYEAPPAEEAVASNDDGAVTTGSTAGGNKKRKKKEESVQDIINSVFLN